MPRILVIRRPLNSHRVKNMSSDTVETGRREPLWKFLIELRNKFALVTV